MADVSEGLAGIETESLSNFFLLKVENLTAQPQNI